MNRIFAIFLTLALFCISAISEEAPKKSVFVFSAATGSINNEVKFEVPGSSVSQVLKDSGQLYGIYMLYAVPNLIIGSSGDFSILGKSSENNYLFFTRYFFGNEGEIQPVFGLTVDYISFYTQLNTADVPPLSSLDVDSSIWGTHATAGISFKISDLKLSPFIGYFNEQVNTVVTSPGMLVAGVNKYGFKSTSYVSLNYFSLGSGFDLVLYHFLRLSSSVYFRFGQNEPALFTARNRIDVFLSREFGLSCKIDYFQDKYETNSFITVGPVLVF